MEQLFIQLLDNTFFNSTKKNELINLFDTTQKESINRCSYIITRGDKKNQSCGKPCNDTFCSSHKSKQKMDTEVKKIEHNIMAKKLENKCTTVLKNGKNKGTPCGKPCIDKYCSTHDIKQAQIQKLAQKQRPVELCGMIIKHGNDKGTICKHFLDINNSCIIHPTLRVSKYKNFFIIKDTNVIFDDEAQCVIGYKHGTDIVMEENKEVVLVCKQYDLEYNIHFRKRK